MVRLGKCSQDAIGCSAQLAISRPRTSDQLKLEPAPDVRFAERRLVEGPPNWLPVLIRERHQGGKTTLAQIVGTGSSSFSSYGSSFSSPAKYFSYAAMSKWLWPHRLKRIVSAGPGATTADPIRDRLTAAGSVQRRAAPDATSTFRVKCPR